MYVRTIKKNNKYYAQLVESYREKGKVKQRIILYFGEVSESMVPYLKAAYSKEKPTLVYKDGSVFKG